MKNIFKSVTSRLQPKAEKRAGEPPAENPLGTQPIGKLMLKFAIPAIASSLINAVYNITDQIFIGQSVGYLGNAATNIEFPIATFCTAVTIMLGVGGASNFNLCLGAGKKDEASRIVATSVSLLAILGICIGVITLIFTDSLMNAFGATEQIFPYAVTYTRIIACGIPFVIFASGCTYIIRADGSPTYSMLTIASGGVLNMILDPIFIFVFNMGIAGAAIATVISQIVSFLFALRYMFRFKNAKLAGIIPHLKATCTKAIAKLGAPSFLNHFMMMIVQITMNNMLRKYGAASIYGTDIPIAVVGVIAKLNIIVIAFNVGTSQGCQPIYGFNFGAKNYTRVKSTYKRAALVVIIISTIIFGCFQLFPRQIVSIFGTGSELYFHFAERYMRIYMMLVCLFGLQPLTAGFFTSIGKAYKGLFITITRQGLFLLPMLLILPRIMGLDGIVYAGPISDGVAILIAIIFIVVEFQIITKLEKAQSLENKE